MNVSSLCLCNGFIIMNICARDSCSNEHRTMLFGTVEGAMTMLLASCGNDGFALHIMDDLGITVLKQ